MLERDIDTERVALCVAINEPVLVRVVVALCVADDELARGLRLLDGVPLTFKVGLPRVFDADHE